MAKINEEVVLFPLRSHDPTVKVLRIARVPEGKLENKSVQHIAGGPYKGIIVSKATQAYPTRERPHAVREFLAHVLDTKTKKRSNRGLRERRKVFMWFKDGSWDREQIADRFFKTLIDPDQFPKDYISFVKKVIVLAKSYHMLRTIELELSPALDEYRSSVASSRYRTSWIEKPTYLNNDESPAKTESRRKRPTSTPISGYMIEEESKNTEDSLVNENKSAPGVTQERSDAPKALAEVSRKDEKQLQTPPEKKSSASQHVNDYSGSRVETRTDSAPEKGPEKAKEVTEITIVEKTVTRSMTSPAAGHQVAAAEERQHEEGEENAELTEEERTAHRMLVLTALEDAFPNALDAQQISSATGLSEQRTQQSLSDCSGKGLVKELDSSRWIRVSTVKRRPASGFRLSGFAGSRTSAGTAHDFQVVPQMPALPDREQPRIAIITLLYCEKQAVDVMMEAKTTYVRYKTEGEGQVYTIGSIGPHRVVSTKLIRVGKGQGATVSAGNLITRLLGTFGKVDHVFLVGVGGGVPDYDDDVHHVRCGDVVVSKPQSEGSAIYISLTGIEGSVASGDISFGTRTWAPQDAKMAAVIGDLAKRYSAHSMVNLTVSQYVQAGLGELDGQGVRFGRPAPDADRLRRLGDDGAWIDVEHPAAAPNSARRVNAGRPVLLFGNVGTGYDQLVTGTSDARHEFAMFNNVYALDVGYQAVLESIEGNRKDSFWIVRGIADYVDGMSGSDWQPYASLAAAAVLKTILMRLPPSKK